jgi:hypothetical protein
MNGSSSHNQKKISEQPQASSKNKFSLSKGWQQQEKEDF